MMTSINVKDKIRRKHVEQGLGSIGRLRILRILASGDASQTKYRLEKSTGLKPIDVRKHLKILIDTGWVNEYNYHPPVYKLNDEKSPVLVEFFKKIGYLRS